MRAGDVFLFLRNSLGIFRDNAAEARQVTRFLRALAGVLDEQGWEELAVADLTAFAARIGAEAPLLDALQQAGRLDRLSPAERRAGVGQAAKTALWNQGYLDELARIGRQLGVKGVDYLVVRGPVLVARAYGDPLKRRFTDLDLLVRPEQLDGALHALAHAGYERTQRTDRDIKRRGWKGVIELIREGEPRSFDVDLHTTLLNRRRLQPVFDLDAPDVWDQRTAEALSGIGRVPALGLEDSLIQAVAHLALQHQMSDLRSLLDCAMLVRRKGGEIRGDRLLARARQAGCETLLSCVLSMIGEIVPLPEDEGLQRAAARGRNERARHPLSMFFSIQNCLPELRETDFAAWQWVVERQSLFSTIDRLGTAIRLALSESVPSAWRVRRLRSRRLSRLGRLLWSVPMGGLLPWYLPVLLGHVAFVRFLGPLTPSR